MFRRFVFLALLATLCLAALGCGRGTRQSSLPPSGSTQPPPSAAPGTAMNPDDDNAGPRQNDPRPGRMPGYLQEPALQSTPTPLPDATNPFDAVRRGQVRVLTSLLDKNPGDAKITDAQGRTPLHLANRRAMVELLVARGAAIEARDKRGNTPLFYVVARGNLIALRKFLEAGPDLNAANHMGFTPLHEAARQGHRDSAQLLIEKGARVDLASKDGVTPLMLAVATRAELCVELLLSKSASVQARDANGNTALHIAANDGSENLVELLVAKGADVNAQNVAGNTPLHISVLTEHAETAQQLLAKGANPALKNKAGQTPAEMAASQGNTYMVNALKGTSSGNK